MAVTGPDFIALQVRDIERAAAFYEKWLGLTRSPQGPTHAVVFATTPIAFALRDTLPGVDLDEVRPGAGVVLWFHADNAGELHDTMAAGGVDILKPLSDGPFGPHFIFQDLDGYGVTVHTPR